MLNRQDPKDLTFNCIDCGRPWVFSVNEQRFYESKGLVTPKRCPECRAARKATINQDDGRRYE